MNGLFAAAHESVVGTFRPLSAGLWIDDSPPQKLCVNPKTAAIAHARTPPTRCQLPEMRAAACSSGEASRVAGVARLVSFKR
jgi:hypothetical protein